MSKKNKIQLLVVGAALAAAFADQLSRAPADRTWHGRIAGIPYDWRRPTLARLRETFWNPENPSLLAPHTFGMGWSINAYRLVHPRAA